MKRGAAAMLALGCVLLASCIREDTSDCFTGVYIKVVVSTAVETGVGEDPDHIADADIESVSLYVFDGDKTLLEIIPTEVGKTEVLDHPGAGDLHVVAVANDINECQTTCDMTAGTSKHTDGYLSLTKTKQSHSCGAELYHNPDDLFWGSVDVPNTGKANSGPVELKIKRAVAGVYIRVRGLKDYMQDPQASEDEFTVLFGAPYNRLSFQGQASATRAASDPVNHSFTGSFRMIEGKEYFEVPVQGGGKTGFHNILASDSGAPVTISIYRGNELVLGRDITADSYGNRLTAKNGKLNTYDISLDGNLTVTVKSLSWGVVPPVDKEF